MPGTGWQELAIVMVVAILIFGTKRLPEIGRSMGKAIREFRAGTIDQLSDEVVRTVEPGMEEATRKAG